MKRNAQRGKDDDKFHSQLFIEYVLIAVLFGAAGVVLASAMRDGILTSLSTLTSSVEQVKSLENDAVPPPLAAEPQELQLGINAIQ